MKYVLILIAIIALSGCVAFPAAKYDVELTYDPATGVLISQKFKSSSRRDFKQIKTGYGDFTFEAGEVSSQASPIEAAIAGILPSVIAQAFATAYPPPKQETQ